MTIPRRVLLLCAAVLPAGCPHDLTRPNRDGTPILDVAVRDGAAVGELGAADRGPSSSEAGCPHPCVSTYAGRCENTGFDQEARPLDQAYFNHPGDLIVETPESPPGMLVMDTTNRAIRRIAGGWVTTAVALPTVAEPTGLARKSSNDLFVSDLKTKQVFEVVDGKVSWYAGTTRGDQDGPVATAQLWEPESVLWVEGTGLLVADGALNKIRLVAGGIVSTYAGSGDSARTAGSLLLAGFDDPHHLALDPDGSTIYVSENEAVRKIVGTTVVTLAKTGLSNPYGVVTDPSGALLVADASTNVIRRIANGSVSTLAGTSGPGYRDGPGYLAAFRSPHGLVIGLDGAVYVSDTDNHCIRVIR